MNSVASDGASENRAANKNITTLIAQDFLINNQVKLDELKRAGFPMNMKVAFNHPILSNDGIVIFIDSDMPHLIKKLFDLKMIQNYIFMEINCLHKCFIDYGKNQELM